MLMVFSPDWKTLAAACEHTRDDTVRLWEVSTGKRLHTLKHPWGVMALAYGPGGRTLASSSSEVSVIPVPESGRKADSDIIHLWDAVTGAEIRRLTGHKSLINALHFSPDGRLLASASHDRTVRVWNTATGKELRCLQGHPSGVRAVIFSPDGRLIASAGYDETVCLWEVATGSEVRRTKDRADRLAFAPDGSTLVSAVGVKWGNDNAANVLSIWDVITGELVGRLPGHADGVTLLRFSPDGKVVLSGGEDCTLLAWDASAWPGARPAAPLALAPGKLESCWGDLAGTDAARAYQAVCTMVTAPRQAASFLGERLLPEPSEVPPHIATLIASLDDERFAVREEATAELAKSADQAETSLRKALASGPSPEVRGRVKGLLERLEGATPSPEGLRVLRAVDVLERVGIPAAKEVIERLARGAPEARLTQDAKASLERLSKRHSLNP
jgi:hypothetical protein